MERFDPVDAFFSGCTSGISRSAIAVGVVVAAFILTCFLGAYDEWAYAGFLGVLMLFQWGLYGAWFLVGLAACALMLLCVFLFMREINPKLTFFGIFTFGIVYFLPLLFPDRLQRMTGWYLGLSVSYWLVPPVIGYFWEQKREREGASN